MADTGGQLVLWYHVYSYLWTVKIIQIIIISYMGDCPDAMWTINLLWCLWYIIQNQSKVSYIST